MFLHVHACVMENFRFILPSNVPAFSGRENTPSQFQATLQDPVRLVGDWEVALEEMTYVHAIFTIDRQYVVLGPRDPKPPALELHVESVNSSPENIHHAENDRVDLTYDHKDKTLRFTVKKHPKKLYLQCTRPLAEACGFVRPKVPAVVHMTEETERIFLAESSPHEDVIISSKFPFGRGAGLTELKGTIIGQTAEEKELPSKFLLHPGHCNDVQTLLTIMNRQMKHLVLFHYDTILRRVSFEMKRDDFTLKFEKV